MTSSSESQHRTLPAPTPDGIGHRGEQTAPPQGGLHAKDPAQATIVDHDPVTSAPKGQAQSVGGLATGDGLEHPRSYDLCPMVISRAGGHRVVVSRGGTRPEVDGGS
jgi:hypothetical protein